MPAILPPLLDLLAPASGVVENTEAEAARAEDPERDRLFDFNTARIWLKRIVDSWAQEMEDTDARRKERDVDLNTESLRQRGDLDEDETIIPVRVIDTNIQREQPAYVNYLKNSRRICTFRSLDTPDQQEDQVQKLELEFTRGMTYLEWELPHYRCLDGAQTHGWDAVEVVLDTTKPLNVGIEHIGHDMLFFPKSVKNIQQSARLIRAYDLTVLQLQSFVEKFGFDKEEVDRIYSEREDSDKLNETLRVYKEYFKHQGVVYVDWFVLEQACQNWIKAPAILDIGLIDVATGQPRQLTQYPVFILYYRETEKPKVLDHKGRCFLDGPKQEAQTAVLSGFVNGMTRASNVYAAQSQEDGTGSSLKELQDIKLLGSRIFNKPITFFSPDYPDPMVLKALQYFDTSNAQETNQTNFAVMNREDSRKTAKEISAAQEQQSLLNSVSLTLFSAYVRAVYSFCWLIVQSQALQNKIKFLQIAQQIPVMNPAMPNTPVVDPNTGQPIMQTIYVNNIEVLKQAYDVRAAGDVDVVQRQEKIQQMMQDWPVISQTALRDQFLAELMRLKYPDQGDQWAGVIMQNGQLTTMQSLISRLSIMLKGTIDQAPDLLKMLGPKESASIQQTLQEATQYMPLQAAKQLQSGEVNVGA